MSWCVSFDTNYKLILGAVIISKNWVMPLYFMVMHIFFLGCLPTFPRTR